jgi:hypothetical protein
MWKWNLNQKSEVRGQMSAGNSEIWRENCTFWRFLIFLWKRGMTESLLDRIITRERGLSGLAGAKGRKAGRQDAGSNEWRRLGRCGSGIMERWKD